MATDGGDVGVVVFIVMLGILVLMIPFMVVGILVMAVLHISVVIPWYISRYLFRRVTKWYY